MSPIKEVARKKRAFTLIELLVVMAIIAILASLLIPALSKAKSQARKIKCLSNQKQLVLTWLLYTGDHDEALALNGQKDNSEPNILWVSGTSHPNIEAFTSDEYLLSPEHASFAPYLRTPAIYKCPADSGELHVVGGKGLAGGRTAQRNRTYSMNGYVGATPMFASTQDYILPHYRVFKKGGDLSVASPVNIFVFQDVNPASICFPAFVVRMPGGRIDGFFHYPATHHNRSGVLGFADGHVEMHRWSDPRTFRTVGTASILVHVEKSPNNADLGWIREHTTVAHGN